MMKMLRRFLGVQYSTPNLHEGAGWGGPELLGTGDQLRVRWIRDVVQVYPHTYHEVRMCTIGPGMAHVDKCWCGSERYGVFGSWS